MIESVEEIRAKFHLTLAEWNWNALDDAQVPDLLAGEVEAVSGYVSVHARTEIVDDVTELAGIAGQRYVAEQGLKEVNEIAAAVVKSHAGNAGGIAEASGVIAD